MKTVLRLFLLAAIGGAVYYFGFRNKETAPVKVADKPLEINTNTTSVSGSVGRMLATYYNLSNAFVKGDAGTVDIIASQFRTDVDTIDIKSLKADAALVSTAQTLKETISAEVMALVKTPGIEEKRKSFQLISDAIYDLVRTVKYDQATVYQMHCPMAFNNTGANWLSNVNDVVNPYFGKKMLHCGEMQDSINFRPVAAAGVQ
jgi:hypothetical protein